MWKSFRNDIYNTGVSKYNAFIRNNRNISRIHIGGIVWGTAIIDENNNIYVGSSNRLFICIGNDDKIKWSYKLKRKNDSLIDSAAVLHDQTNSIIIPGGDGAIHALNKNDGTIKWIWTPEYKEDPTDAIVNSFEGNIQVDSNGNIYVGCDNNYFYCINGYNGLLKWSYYTDMMIWSCACLAHNENVIIFGCLDRYIYMLDSKTGQLFDKYKTSGEIKSSPLTFNNQVIICNSDGEIYNFDISKKKFILLWSISSHVEIYSSPAYKNGILIIAKMNGEIFALNVNNKNKLWFYTTSAPFCSSPIISNNNIVLIGSSDGKLYSFDLFKGFIGYCDITLFYDEHERHYRKNLNASPAMDKNGNIYIGSYDGYIYNIPSYLCNKTNYNINTNLLQLVHNKIIKQYRFNIENIPLAVISSIKTDKNIPYEIIVSSDGKYVNLIPKFMFGLHIPYKIELHGKYYLQSNRWWKDRLNFFSEENFNITIDIQPFTYKKTPIDKVNNTSIICWDIWDFFSTQPRILDTYIPAAMNALSYKIFAFGFHKKPKDIKIHFNMLLIPTHPAVNTSEEFIYKNDITKILIFKAVYFEGIILTKTIDNFEISVMGGTIPYNIFNTYMAVDENDLSLDCDFYTVASCLNIKGNGKKYEFSGDIVNKICNPLLNIISVGNFRGQNIKLKNEKNVKVYEYDNFILILLDKTIVNLYNIISIVEFNYDDYIQLYKFELNNKNYFEYTKNPKYKYIILLNDMVIKLLI